MEPITILIADDHTPRSGLRALFCIVARLYRGRRGDQWHRSGDASRSAATRRRADGYPDARSQRY